MKKIVKAKQVVGKKEALKILALIEKTVKKASWEIQGVQGYIPYLETCIRLLNVQD